MPKCGRYAGFSLTRKKVIPMPDTEEFLTICCFVLRGHHSPQSANAVFSNLVFFDFQSIFMSRKWGKRKSKWRKNSLEVETPFSESLKAERGSFSSLKADTVGKVAPTHTGWGDTRGGMEATPPPSVVLQPSKRLLGKPRKHSAVVSAWSPEVAMWTRQPSMQQTESPPPRRAGRGQRYPG